jgi:hypothetical protein
MMVYEMIVNVKKDELIAKLKENRDRHRTVFLAALEGYRAEAYRVLSSYIKQIEEGRTPVFSVGTLLSRPEDHTKDYDHVIGMLEMDQSDVFRLDQQTYRNYVGDDWSWKRQWAKLSSAYAGRSYTENYGVDDDGEEW